MYDNVHWVGMVSEVDHDNSDSKIKFMHPHLPATSFKWPSRDDICWVPNLHIVCTVNAPSLLTQTARQYYFKSIDMEKIRSNIENYKHKPFIV